ncbi:Copia protein, partial [Mucuna pruriens]
MVFVVLQSKVIMEKNLKMLSSKPSVKRMVAERKSRNLEEMAKTMLCENSLVKYFWAEAIYTTYYVQDRILIRPILNKTPYELWRGRIPNISYFHPFGCDCSLLNRKDQLRKFDSKVDKGIFLGYSHTFKAYRVYNSRTLLVEESNVADTLESSDAKANPNHQMITTDDQPHKDCKFVTYHTQDLILRDKVEGIKTISSFRNQASCALISMIEPRNIEEILRGDPWKKNYISSLEIICGNLYQKFNEDGKVVRNKERGKVDTTLFRKEENKDFIIVQIYVDDIMFGATNERLCKNFSNLMQSEFEMSMIGELKFFLGLQKYKKELLKFKTKDAKPMSKTIDQNMNKRAFMHLSVTLSKYEQGKIVDQTIYRVDLISCSLYAYVQDFNQILKNLIVVKRILRYIVDTINLSLLYKKNQDF